MKLLVLYRPNSEQARSVENYIDEFKRLHPEKEITLEDIDGKEGSSLAKLYDIVQYPALIVLDGEGKVISSWAGDTLPLLNDVFGYLNS